MTKASENIKKEFYSTKELAELLGLAQRTIYRYIDSGDLRAIKIGDQWRISRSDLDTFLSERVTNQNE